MGHSLDLEFDFPAERFWGTVATRFSALNDGLESLDLDAVDLNIKAVRGGDGSDLEFDYDGEVLTIHLAGALAEAEETEVTVEYSGEKPLQGLYFRHPSPAYPLRTEQVWTQGEQEMHRYWYPSYDFPNEQGKDGSGLAPGYCSPAHLEQIFLRRSFQHLRATFLHYSRGFPSVAVAVPLWVCVPAPVLETLRVHRLPRNSIRPACSSVRPSLGRHV